MKPIIKKNDKTAKWLIYTLSIVVFLVVALLSSDRIEVPYPFDFDVKNFALANAIINSMVSIFLVLALVAVKQKNIVAHKNLMFSAIILSCLFLVSYICHHLWAGKTTYGGEGLMKVLYYFILITHIILAGVILPFILFTAYRGLTMETAAHRKLAKYTWPLWFYVSITGVIVYLMISPYYN